MPPVLEIVPHRTGPWLVMAGAVIYAVPPRLGRALQPLAGKLPDRREISGRLADVRPGSAGDVDLPDLASWAAELSAALDPARNPGRPGTTERGPGRSVRFRVPLLGAAVVRRLAGKLKVLAGDRGLAALALLGGLGYLAAGFLPLGPGSAPPGVSWDPVTVALGLGLFLLTALWHELGHAAGLARSGYPPGGIGAGVLFVIPVLFADVTAVGALPRSGRLRVDLAGVVFQGALGGLFLALSRGGVGPGSTGSALALAGSSALLAISWSLFPFIRSDGYWLLCDFLGLDSLDRPPALPVGRGLRNFLVGYQLANAAFLLLVGVFVPLKIIGLLGALVSRLGIPADPAGASWLAAAAGLGLVAALGPGAARRIRALVRSALTVARGATGTASLSDPDISS